MWLVSNYSRQRKDRNRLAGRATCNSKAPSNSWQASTVCSLLEVVILSNGTTYILLLYLYLFEIILMSFSLIISANEHKKLLLLVYIPSNMVNAIIDQTASEISESYFKEINHHFPLYPWNHKSHQTRSLKNRSEYHSHNLRNWTNLNLPLHRQQQTSKTLKLYTRAKFLNLLLSHLRNTTKPKLIRPYYNLNVKEFYKEHGHMNREQLFSDTMTIMVTVSTDLT